MLKKESEAWKLAKRMARRKSCHWVPVELSPCGTVVMVQSIIRGNYWRKTLQDLRLQTK